MYGIGLLLPWSVILSIFDYLAAMVSIMLVKIKIDARIQPTDGLPLRSKWPAIICNDLGNHLRREILFHHQNCIDFYAKRNDSCYNSTFSAIRKRSWLLVRLSYSFLLQLHPGYLPSFCVFIGGRSSLLVYGRRDARLRISWYRMQHLQSADPYNMAGCRIP